MAQTAQAEPAGKTFKRYLSSVYKGTDKVFTCATRLHGTVQILLQPIAVLFAF